MPLTFVHTADWHLGRWYRRIGPRSLETHAWRFEAVRNAYELAVRRQAAFILVAGDVFQTDTPTARVLDEAVALLRDAPVPTILIPGNHDPLTEGSVWRRDDFAGRLRGLENIRLALTCQPLELECDATIFPCPVPGKSCPEDLSAWIPPGQRGGRYRIGLAHGIWQGYDGQEHYENFIDARRAEASGLDYLALGDLHSYTPPDHPAARLRSFYSGTIECTAADEVRPGHVLLVNLLAPGKDPEVEPVHVGRMRPVPLPPLILNPADGLTPLRQQVDAIENPGDVLLCGQVAGVLSREQWAEFEEWSNSLLTRFLGVDLDVYGLYSEPSAADFEALGLDEAQLRILNRLRQGADLKLPADTAQELVAALASDPAARREALSLYYGYLQRGGRA